MTSEYGKDQRKLRLFTAIKMRDAKVERLNRKTGKIEVLPYSRQYIKQVTGIKAYEAVHLGIFKKPVNELQRAIAQHARDHQIRNQKREARGKAPLPMKAFKPAI